MASITNLHDGWVMYMNGDGISNIHRLFYSSMITNVQDSRKFDPNSPTLPIHIRHVLILLPTVVIRTHC